VALSLLPQPDLITAPRGAEIDWRRVLLFLQRRQDLLDAVVFSGGEPTLRKRRRRWTRCAPWAFAWACTVPGSSAGFANALRHADWVGFDVKALAEDYPWSPRSKAAASPLAQSGGLAGQWRGLRVPHHGA
jgi:pyruvate-formate lyase-activating enzyme